MSVSARALIPVVLLSATLPMASSTRAQDVAEISWRDGLAGADRVGDARLGDAPRLAFVGAGGYGILEGSPSEHHRATGAVAGAASVLPWLRIAVGAIGWYDVHPADELGPDDTGLGLPWLAVRASVAPTEWLALGLGVRGEIGGADAPDFDPSAGALEITALGTFSVPSTDLAILVSAGYRADGTGNGVGDPAQLRSGDRVSLGASAFDRVLLGAGVTYALAPSILFAELTWEPWVGDGAPRLRTAPLRVAGGARVALLDALAVGAQLEATLQPLPSVEPGAPLIPVEPRVSVLITIAGEIDLAPAPPRVEEPVDLPIEQAPAPERRRLGGRVTTDGGDPIAGAEVTLRGPGDDESARLAHTDEHGGFRFDDLAPGTYELRVQAEDREPTTTAIEVAPDADPEVPEIVLAPVALRASLRGLVRDFAGRPVTATITVEPLGLTAQTQDGYFETELDPGSYSVVVEADGFRAQRREVEVRDGEVTVLNVDLHRAR